MKRFLFLFLFVFCSNAQYSFLPPKLDIDSLMPLNINVIDSTLNDFVSIPIDSGRLITIYKDTLRIPSGILISEKKAAFSVFYKNNSEFLYKKSMLSNKLYDEFYLNAIEAEKKYHHEIKQLENSIKRSWLEKNSLFIGFAIGLATAVLTEFAVIKGQQ